ncbi:NAD(P)H-binding protein [Streptomyces pactum]|uniref:NAD(P)-dependent oxidoreductase n=1 Tax=Streptomyces pactum TaxID=68249 RepID=A0A1S6J1R7_9ACTN|nr:NAD(P)H-binding protein [Streptomyces pactum]AQS65698.1 NAD(P)-dependent oxidoreductase [Streptomyces pactum]AQS71558.1 NAD(P)-dependent oxidoreductase [Streptomyces pactum]
MILVTGATGTVGGEVLRRLPAHLAVRVMARDPSRVARPGCRAEVVAGDYGDPCSLGRAVEGVGRALVLTSRVGGDDDARFVDAARAAGVRHLVKVSAAAVADSGADDVLTRWQRRNEDLLLGSGLRWTVLRPRSFMSNTLSWAVSIAGEQVVRGLYGTSLNACVDPRDVAAAAVCALTEDGHEGRIHTLTGPEPISAVEQTAQLGRLLGRPLRFEELSPRRARVLLRERYPEPVVEALLAGAERQRAGAKAGVEDTVGRLTGRAARSFRTWAGDHLGAFGAVPGAAGAGR